MDDSNSFNKSCLEIENKDFKDPIKGHLDLIQEYLFKKIDLKNNKSKKISSLKEKPKKSLLNKKSS